MASLPLKNITRLIRRARRDGSASSQKYRAVVDSKGDLELYHYGTLILETESGSIWKLGGWSNSDRDAINSALMVLGIDAKVSGAQKAPSDEYKRLDGWWVKGI